MLHNAGAGTYCCLGVLQHCLTGETEDLDSTSDDELPTPGWLDANGIDFYYDENNPWGARQPMLHSLGGRSAADANDSMQDVGQHKYNFIQIADAIKEAVEFTDA